MTLSTRSLLSDARRASEGVFRLSTGSVPLTQSEGELPIVAPRDRLIENPLQEDPKLWYGIGILYDRYGSLDHAEEAFASVLRMDKGGSGSAESCFHD